MTRVLYCVAQRLLVDRRAQDLIEYALLAGFVAVVAGSVFPAALIPGVSGIFSKLDYYFQLAAAQGS